MPEPQTLTAASSPATQEPEAMPDFPGLGSEGSGPPPDFFTDDAAETEPGDPSEEVPAAEGTPAPSDTPAPVATEGESRPWHTDPRFKADLDWVKQKEQIAPYLPLIQQLQAQGLSSADAVSEAIARQQQETARQAEEAALYQRLKQQVDEDEITAEQANAEWQAAIQQRQLTDTLARLERYETEQQWNQIAGKFPFAEKNAALALSQQKGIPLEAAAAALNKHVEGLVNQRLTQQQARTAAAKAAPVPLGGGQAPPAREKTPAGSAASQEFSWEDYIDGKRS